MVSTELAENHYQDVLAIDDWFGDDAADYDVEAVRREVLNLANERLPEGVTLFIGGDVVVNLDVVSDDALDDITWGELISSEDLENLAKRHLV